MTRFKTKDEDIHLKLTKSQKEQLKILAELSKKSVTQYLLDAGLSLTLDTAKTEFYKQINDDLVYLKRQNFITSQLVLLLLRDRYPDNESLRKIYKAAEEKAKKDIMDVKN